MVLVIEAATFAGLIILLVQFANIMTTVRINLSGQCTDYAWLHGGHLC